MEKYIFMARRSDCRKKSFNKAAFFWSMVETNEVAEIHYRTMKGVNTDKITHLG